MGTQNFSAKQKIFLVAFNLVFANLGLTANPQELETARQFANVADAAKDLKESVEAFAGKIPKNDIDSISKSDLDAITEAVRKANEAANDNPEARNQLRPQTKLLADALKPFTPPNESTDRAKDLQTLRTALADAPGKLERVEAQANQIAANAANGQGNGQPPQNPQNQNVAENQQGAAGGGGNGAGGAGGGGGSSSGAKGGGGNIMTSYVQSLDGKAFLKPGSYGLAVASKLTGLEEKAIYNQISATLASGFGNVGVASAPVPKPSFLTSSPSGGEVASENKTFTGDKLVSNAAGNKVAGATSLKAPTLDTVAAGSTKSSKVKAEVWEEALTSSDIYNARKIASVAEPEQNGIGLARDAKPVSIISSGHQMK